MIWDLGEGCGSITTASEASLRLRHRLMPTSNWSEGRVLSDSSLITENIWFGKAPRLREGDCLRVKRENVRWLGGSYTVAVGVSGATPLLFAGYPRIQADGRRQVADLVHFLFLGIPVQTLPQAWLTSPCVGNGPNKITPWPRRVRNGRDIGLMVSKVSARRPRWREKTLSRIHGREARQAQFSVYYRNGMIVSMTRIDMTKHKKHKAST